ncbi:MAG: DEAD/DEAH box helicase, partial [Victivallaceae bacterium]
MKIDADKTEHTPQDDVIKLDDCLVEYKQDHLESYHPRKKNVAATSTADADAAGNEGGESAATTPGDTAETLTTQEAIDKFFCQDGLLKATAELAGRPYEYRKQQQLMATAIVKSLQADKNLCVEAPTGVGKSFAYLVPLIYTAKFRKHPAVISTATITLQEQLINKDLPVLEQITGEKIKFVLAKGRGNYVCLRRLAMLTDDRRDSLLGRPSLTAEIQRIYTLQQEKNYGEREEFGFQTDIEAWSMVCCEGGNCMGQKCRFMKNCHYW